MTIVFIVFGGGFRTLINFAVVASWSFYFMTVRADCSLSLCSDPAPKKWE